MLEKPDKWQETDLASAAEIVMGQSPPGYTYNKAGRGIPLINGPVEFGSRYPTKIQWTTAPTKHCRAGDVLFCVRGSTTGRMNIANGDYCIGRGIAAIRGHPGIASTDFLERCLSALASRILEEAKGSGSTFPSISSSRLAASSVLLPPLAEQQQIAEILDTLDDAIRKTEEIIAKLKQVKQGLLHDLLTRGIDENGELRDPVRHPEQFKDSPLGRIPRTWNTAPGEDCFTLHGGTTPALVREDSKGKFLYLKVDDFNLPENEFRLYAAQATFDDLRVNQQTAGRVFPPEVVVFPKRGAAIFKNRARVLGNPGTIDPNLMAARPTKLLPEILASYLVYFDLSNICDNSGLPQINNKHLYPLEFPVPPAAEQQGIMQRLDAVDARQQEESAELEKLIALKQGLMEDLLTGKVRVTPLLDEAT